MKFMDTTEITNELKKSETAIIKFFESREPAFWEKKPEGKWTAGQHIIHLVQSTRPLLKAVSLPGFFLKWKFGTSNRPSRTYDQVVARYLEKLASAPDVVSPFSSKMPESPAGEKQRWFSELSQLNDKLNKKTAKLTDRQLDTLIVPHPLLGKMTLREILMWNTFHTEHHRRVLLEKYV